MKNRLTKGQLENLVRQQLTDEVRRQIDEGVWDSIKYGIAKLGSLEASGKLLGKDKARKAAQDKLETALDKHSNKAVKDLIDAIKADEDTKEFPNMKDQFAFQSALASILVYYDSLKASVEKYQPGKEEQPEGAMSPEAANAIVEVLHQYLVNVMDNKLSDVYKHFKESLEQEGYTLAEMLAEQDEEPEEQFYDKKSTAMAGLESNFLPAALSLLGGAAYTAGQVVAATAPLMYTKDFVTDPGKLTQVPDATKEYFNAVVDSRGKGMLKTFSDSASALSGETVRPMDFAKSVDIIAQKTGNSPEEVIKDVMGTLGREEHREVSGELSTLMYNYAKEGGSVGDVVNATAIKPEFVEFAKESGASDALVAKFEAAEKAAAAAKAAAKQAASSAASDAVTSLPDADDVAGAAKDVTKQAAATAADSPDEIPASMAKAMKDQARGSSTYLGAKEFSAAERAAAKEEFVKQKGTFNDYFNNFKANNPEEFEKMKKGAFGPGQTLKRRYRIEFNNFLMKPFMKKIKEAAATAALGSGAVKHAGFTLLGMEPGGAVMNLAGKIATSAAKTAIKQGAVTAGTQAAALVPGLGAILAPMGITVASGGLAIKLLRMKGKKSSRVADLQTARDYIKKFAVEDPVLDPEPEEGGEEGPGAGVYEEGSACEQLVQPVRDLDLKVGDIFTYTTSKGVEKQAMVVAVEGMKQIDGWRGGEIKTVGDVIDYEKQCEANGGRYIQGPAFISFNMETGMRMEEQTLDEKGATKRTIKIRNIGENVTAASLNYIYNPKGKKTPKGDKSVSPAAKVPEGYEARLNIKDVIRSDKVFKQFLKSYTDQLVTSKDRDQKVKDWENVMVPELKRRRGMSDEKPKDEKPQADEPKGKDQVGKTSGTPSGKSALAGGTSLDDLLGVKSGIKNQKGGSKKKVRPPTDAGTMKRRRKTRGGRALEEQDNLQETLDRWAKIAGIIKESKND